ncbi:MAG: hypothetical protein Q9200_005842 [Gallowayella weberi]
MMVKRVYFGNWLRDYSQAVDVGTLKGIQSATIRILVWVLSFLSFGYATAEFEVTEERLGVYRPEEHIDNPKDYADNADARQYDPRLRPPVQPIELQVDLNTGMKNYIANEHLGIATSAGYIKHSFARSVHFGRVYTNGAGGSSGKEADLCEALRCLGQGLHCLEDFGAHTNYTELALREIGYHNVFPHCGSATEINLRGRRVYPLVTGTFGAVDFLHSVLGEATDHFAQTEINQMDIALGDAQKQANPAGGARSGAGESQLSSMTSLLSQMPGAGGFCQQAEQLQAQADAQERANAGQHYRDVGAPTPHVNTQFSAPPGTQGGPPGPGIPGMSANFDPIKTAAQIYPILEFRDRVAKAISATIEKIPGLEALVEKITERLTLFVLSLLAPFIRPIINAVSAQLKAGSSVVVDASGKHQYEPWTDPYCSDPTHSLLSKDHFSNILNEPAGKVASAILTYVAPRILYAWQHPDIPLDQVLNDIVRVFHHPAARDHGCEVHQTMFAVVERWARTRQGPDLNGILSSESVKAGKNHIGGHDAEGVGGQHNHGGLPYLGSIFPGSSGGGGGGNSHPGSGGGGMPNMSSFFPASIGSYGNKITGAFGGPSREISNDGDAVSAGMMYGSQTGYDSTRPASYGYGDPQYQDTPYGQQQQQQTHYPTQQGYYGQGLPPSSAEEQQYPPQQQQQQGYHPYGALPQTQYINTQRPNYTSGPGPGYYGAGGGGGY